MIKKVLKWVFRVIALALVLVTIIIVLNFTFFKRAITYPNDEITNTTWYTPKAFIEGSDTTSYHLTDSLSIDQSVLEDISNYANQQNSSALLVLHKGKLQLEKHWRGYSNESTTNSKSMAKFIVNILVGIAIDEGAIKSEKELVSTYISEWEYDDRNAIRIEDLLHMTSGLRLDDDSEDLFSDVVQMHIGTDAAEVALSVPFDKPPSTAYEYNNVNTQILAIILERVTGVPIESYASSRLWIPIGAADAGWWLDREGGMPKTYSCFFAKAKDWISLGQLVLQNGVWNSQQIIPETWLSKMLTPSQLNKDYGYHVKVHDKDSSPMLSKTYLISGSQRQHIYIVPEHELVFVRLGVTPSDWDWTYIVNNLVASLESENQ